MNINRQYVSNENTTANKTNAKKYIVIHETDNFKKGAGALRHADAQSKDNLSTSVHFYCGSDGVYQAAELDKCVWAVGKTYKTQRPIMDATNYNTINIEICVNEDGDYAVARQNAIELTKYLMGELNIPADRVIRHYDAKGKYCPRSMMDNPELWTSFKEAIAGKKESILPIQSTKTEVYKLKTLKKGSKGKDVTVFESIMAKMGYYKGEFDTNFGPKCVAACNAFQEDHPECGTNGEPDSSWGPKCWKKALSLLKA